MSYRSDDSVVEIGRKNVHLRSGQGENAKLYRYYDDRRRVQKKRWIDFARPQREREREREFVSTHLKLLPYYLIFVN